MDTTEDIARRFIQAWTAETSDAVMDELASPELVVGYSHFPEAIRGPEAFRAMLAQTCGAFPDVVTTVDQVMASGHRVAEEMGVVDTGSLRAQLEAGGA